MPRRGRVKNLWHRQFLNAPLEHSEGSNKKLGVFLVCFSGWVVSGRYLVSGLFLCCACVFVLVWCLSFSVSWLGFLVSWSFGILVSWFAGLLVSWFAGLLAYWFLGFSVSWFLGFLVSCM